MWPMTSLKSLIMAKIPRIHRWVKASRLNRRGQRLLKRKVILQLYFGFASNCRMPNESEFAPMYFISVYVFGPCSGLMVGSVNAKYVPLMIWDEYDQLREEAIVSFVLERENFYQLCLHQRVFFDQVAWSLVEWGGRFCLVDEVACPANHGYLGIEEKNDKWIKEYSIIMKGFSNDFLKSIVPLDYHNWEIVMDAK